MLIKVRRALMYGSPQPKMKSVTPERPGAKIMGASYRRTAIRVLLVFLRIRSFSLMANFCSRKRDDRWQKVGPASVIKTDRRDKAQTCSFNLL